MAWTGQSFAVGQILTAAQMTNLQNDITAAFDKDSGAPVLANLYVVDAMLAASVTAQLIDGGNSHNHTGIQGGAIDTAAISHCAVLLIDLRGMYYVN